MDNLQNGIDPVRVELYDYCATHRIAVTVMKTFGGEKVESLEQWEKVRAPEILERFRHEVFGVRPKEADERSRVSFTC